jgi:hypothetical protein
VIVELFTSEGCSSCPPADAYLTDLSRNRPDVLPLAFHVTYWDYLGWKDPFSLPEATQRQATYAAKLGGGSYTPEIVVDGHVGLVGSDRDAVDGAIRAAHRVVRQSPMMTIVRKNGAVFVMVGSGAGNANVVVVSYDTQRNTQIGRGENGGRTLTESNIVRHVQPIGRWIGEPLTLRVPAPTVGEAFAVLLQTTDGDFIGAAREGRAF